MITKDNTERDISKELKEPFERHSYKIQTCGAKTCMCVAYIDARSVQDRFDDVVGAENWKSEFHRDSEGNLICRISIFSEARGEWISKEDTGSDGNDHGDGAKGEYSDAFKRCAVMWGVGRYLYSLPKVFLNTRENRGRFEPIDDNGNAISPYGNSLTDYIYRSGKYKKPSQSSYNRSNTSSKTNTAPSKKDSEEKADLFIEINKAYKSLEGLSPQLKTCLTSKDFRRYWFEKSLFQIPISEILVAKNKMGSINSRIFYRYYETYAKYKECAPQEVENYSAMIDNLEKFKEDKKKMGNIRSYSRQEEF